jgi:hypothetical protein
MSPDQPQPRESRRVTAPSAQVTQDSVALERWLDEGGHPARLFSEPVDAKEATNASATGKD